jgi:Glycosyl transferases group 1
MRLFQNSGIYPSYRPRLAALRGGCDTFQDAIEIFLHDRFGASHFLKPVLDRSADAFFTNGDDEAVQRMWAKEEGMKPGLPLGDILLAQIEHHRTEIFYNLDPMRYGNDFLARLPGHVRKTIAWRAAPSAGGQFLRHDVIVNNFPSILDGYRAEGARAAYLAPAHDPEMDAYAGRTDRSVDVLFVGTFSRHHRVRAAMLEAIAKLRDRLSVVMHLDTSRYTRLAETPLGWFGPLRKDRRSRDIRSVTRRPVFGRDLLNAISSAKIVVNGAIDMAGVDRGNMRVWEVLGCGAALITDAGSYPDAMEQGEHFLTYSTTKEAVNLVDLLHRDEAQRANVARNGHAMIADRFSKVRQWQRFEEIVG